MDRHGDPRFYGLLEELAELHSNKNHDYAISGDPFSNFRKSEAFGIPAWKGVLTRMSDKWSRIEQLSSGKEPKNESLRDSLIDNAVYSLIAILLLPEPEKTVNGSRVQLSYDEKRSELVSCHCGRQVTKLCGNGTICHMARNFGAVSQGDGASE
jgi:hypothetical protein